MDPNPFAEDDPADFPILTSERRLLRLVMCAADVAARFARENRAGDAAAWMRSPAPMFDFDRPLDACQELDGFVRATLLNGLQADLRASRADLDMLVLDDAWPRPGAAGRAVIQPVRGGQHERA